MRAREFIFEQTADTEQSILEVLIECDRGSWTIVEDNGETIVQFSSMLSGTMSNKPADIEDRLKDFIEQKKTNPLAPYGKSDETFHPEGIIGRAFPKLRHAHLNLDISVFYTMEGKNPRLLKIYGVFRHKESGTGNNSNPKIQKSLVKQLKNVSF